MLKHLSMRLASGRSQILVTRAESGGRVVAYYRASTARGLRESVADVDAKSWLVRVSQGYFGTSAAARRIVRYSRGPA